MVATVDQDTTLPGIIQGAFFFVGVEIPLLPFYKLIGGELKLPRRITDELDAMDQLDEVFDATDDRYRN